MRKLAIVAAGVAVIFLGSLRAEAGTLSLKLHDGLVTIDAKDASIHQIIAEWQKIGRTHFVNADGLTSPPITLQLSNVPERQALDLILQSAAGYMAAPRTTIVPNASVYDLVFVLASSTAPPAPPPGAIRRAPTVLYPQRGPNEEGRPIPVFRPRFPTRSPARGNNQDDSSDDDDNGNAATPTQVITAPVVTNLPGVVVVPPKKKPDGGGR